MSSRPRPIEISVDVPERSYLESLRRWALALAGVVLVGIAALGVVVPGLPTTIFLLGACYLFTRSCPKLEQILIRNRFFAAFHKYLDGEVATPVRTRLLTLAVMWSFIISSCLMLGYGKNVHLAVVSLIPIAGVVGSYFVWNLGKR